MSLRKMVVRLNLAASALLTPLLLSTPVYAASFNPASLPARDWLLMGSLVLLAVAVALRLMRRDRATDVGPDTADLRWWRNP